MRLFILFCLSLVLTACGFHLQGEVKLAPPLQRMYLQAPDPYGYLVRNLKQSLKMSKVKLVDSPNEAETILAISRDDESQEFITVSGTNQTRLYKLKVTVLFEITDTKGRVLMPAQSLVEERVITIQSNQILGSNNEATLLYQQMRRALAYAIINRIASKDVAQLIEEKLKQ
jgi:LPS-assembly lipoprotein